jgi:hypothetical protein
MVVLELLLLLTLLLPLLEEHRSGRRLRPARLELLRIITRVRILGKDLKSSPVDSLDGGRRRPS